MKKTLLTLITGLLLMGCSNTEKLTFNEMVNQTQEVAKGIDKTALFYESSATKELNGVKSVFAGKNNTTIEVLCTSNGLTKSIVINEPFLEDEVINLPVKLTLEEAEELLLEAGYGTGVEGEADWSVVVLRRPLGPDFEFAQYIFTTSKGFVSVDATTGKVTPVGLEGCPCPFKDPCICPESNLSTMSNQTWKNTSSQGTLRVSQGNPQSGHDDFSPTVGTELVPNGTWNNVNGGAWAYLVLDILNGTTYLTTTTVHFTDPVGGAPLDPPVSMDGNNKPDGALTFTKVGDNSYDVSYGKSSYPPPYTTGLIDWTGGQTGKEPFSTPGSYWTQDYNFDDTLRWTSDGTSTVQNTKQTGNSVYGYNYGSRAYPVNVLDSDMKTDDSAYGVAMDGVWQIDIKIGSNGGGTYPDSLFCETFYLAERKVMMWDNKYYLDNSPKGGSQQYSQYGREIDIMETKWQPSGPQANLPNGNPSDPSSQMSWNTEVSGTNGYNKLEAKWEQMYSTFPNPTTYATFGIAILDDGLYFYGYNDKGTQVYVDGPIVLKNDGYTQENPFVPYIGTWTKQDTKTKPGIEGGFSTSYKNFIYKKKTEVSGNPITNKSGFGPGLK